LSKKLKEEDARGDVMPIERYYKNQLMIKQQKNLKRSSYK